MDVGEFLGAAHEGRDRLGHVYGTEPLLDLGAPVDEVGAVGGAAPDSKAPPPSPLLDGGEEGEVREGGPPILAPRQR